MIIGAFAAVCVLAAVGWMRNSDSVANPPPMPAQFQSNAPYADPQAVGQTALLPPVYAGDGYYPTRMRPVYIRQQEVVPAVQALPQRNNSGQEYYSDSRARRHHGRSKTHSVEIVAGTAAVGAAIGAIAGGGKGAAIGAASGAGAGFVYDRVTHNH